MAKKKTPPEYGESPWSDVSLATVLAWCKGSSKVVDIQFHGGIVIHTGPIIVACQ